MFFIRSNISKLISKIVVRFDILRLTFPVVSRVIRKNKNNVIRVILLGILSGIIPIFQFQIEAGLISQISGSISRIMNFDDVLYAFSDINTENSDIIGGIESNFVKSVFHNLRIRESLIIYVLVVLLVFLVAYLLSKLIAEISAELFAELRDIGLRKGLMADPIDLPSLPNIAGQFSSAIQQGAKNISDTYAYLLEIGQHAFSILTTVLIIFISNKSFIFSALCILVVLIQCMLSFFMANSLESSRNKLDKLRNDLNARTDDVLSNRDMVVANEQQGRFLSKIKANSIVFASIEQYLVTYERRFELIFHMINDYGRFIIIAFVFLYAISFKIESTSVIGDVYFMTSIYSSLLASISTVLERYNDIRKSQAISKTFLEIIDDDQFLLRTISTNMPLVKNHNNRNNSIIFDNVSFTYDQKTFILKECSFIVPKGGTTLMVGRSGSGKTTIARAILGFWPTASGHIFVEGGEVSITGKKDVRKKINYISQSSHIIDESVRENLAWVQSKNISDKYMLDIIKKVGISVIDYSILDKSVKEMSLGQQQRLSIARLLLDDSPIMIIDEPLTGVDIFTMKDILPMLSGFFKDKNKTILVFSHNLSLTSYADHIIVLGDDGKILEEGEPLSLLKNPTGIFSNLYKTAKESFNID